MSNAIAVYRGSSATFDVAVADEDGEPVDLTDAALIVTVRDYVGGTLVFDRRNTAAGGGEGEATVIAPASDGVFRFFVTPIESDLLEPGVTYHWDAWVVLSDGTQGCVVDPDDLVCPYAVTEEFLP